MPCPSLDTTSHVETLTPLLASQGFAIGHACGFNADCCSDMCGSAGTCCQDNIVSLNELKAGRAASAAARRTHY